MSKRRKTKVFSFQGFDLAHYKATEAYTRAVSALFDKATDDIANAASRENYNPDKPFSFDDYPKAKAQLQKTIKGLAGKIQTVIETASRKQWLFACQKNDEFIASIFDTTKLTKGQLKKYQDRNLDALQAFQQRKVGGMDLSERVWKYTQQYKEQIETGLDVGLGEGRSAQQLSRDLRQNLKDPNRLFRRVRDKRGNLQLSKSAKAFHPGQGVYRSSYKNAMRLARSEINMSYRESDQLRWQQLDFVLGFEVHRSNREPKCNCELCERLVGRYPKWFKFKGWHPQCLCYAIPILEDFYSKERSDDRVARMRAALRAEEYKKYVSKDLIKDLPDNFKEWASENTEKQKNWASTPYFIRDNFVDGDLSNGLIYEQSKPLTTLQRAALRHEQRTPEQIKDIKDRLEARRKKHELIKSTANNVLAVAKGYSEVDFSALQDAVDCGDLSSMQSVAKIVAKALSEMKKQEQAISNLIPDVHEWHKQFTIKELKAVHSSVEKKLDSWSPLSLEQKAKKLKFEVEEYFGTDKYGAQTKYKAWGVAQAAYKKELHDVQYKIDKLSIESSVEHSFAFAVTTKSANVKKLASELKSLLVGDTSISELQSKASALNAEVSKLEAAKLVRELKKLGKLHGFTPEAYTQERKDKAVWDKGDGSLADKTLIDVAAKNWIAATEEEKDRVFEYTHHYCNINEPLQGRTYYGNQSRSDFEHRVNNITSYIGKNRLPKDMWFMRGDDGIGVIASRIKFAGGTMPNNLQDLVGMKMQEGGFMSTGSRKGKGFSSKPVIINVYAPKGTQAAYVEPISSFGAGAGRNWDGKQRFSKFSYEHETLFQRGTIMRITKVYQVGGKTFIDCEVIGQEVKPLSYVSDSNIGY